MPAMPSVSSIRKRIEEAFGWIETVAGLQKTKFRRRERVGWAFAFAGEAAELLKFNSRSASSGIDSPRERECLRGQRKPVPESGGPL